jgi:hypothetical protein
MGIADCDVILITGRKFKSRFNSLISSTITHVDRARTIGIVSRDRIGRPLVQSDVEVSVVEL